MPTFDQLMADQTSNREGEMQGTEFDSLSDRLVTPSSFEAAMDAR